MPEQKLYPEGNVNPSDILKGITKVETPFYLYDNFLISERCGKICNMPSAFGLFPRYAMKASSNRNLIHIITQDRRMGIDASSLNEAKRANWAGVPFSDILLTSQEVPEGEDRKELERMMLKGMEYNVCSIRQLEEIADFASSNNIPLSMRVHPEGNVGAGESITRNTASKYSCFGVHIEELEKILQTAEEKRVYFKRVHDHIGSGGDPKKWKENTDVLLNIIEKYFSDHPVETVNFGGGIKEARMPEDSSADIHELGRYSAEKVEEFARRTGKRLTTEVEPGSYTITNAGYLITKVIDKKSTGEDGFNFLVLNGGMEVNTRPLMYGAKHPFYVVSSQGDLLSSEFNLSDVPENSMWVPVGRCCESGDSQSLDEEENIIPRKMAEPKIGDFLIIGGCGSYCSTMSPFNYNSHTQAPEVSKQTNGEIRTIRKPQKLEQVMENEV